MRAGGGREAAFSGGAEEDRGPVRMAAAASPARPLVCRPVSALRGWGHPAPGPGLDLSSHRLHSSDHRRVLSPPGPRGPPFSQCFPGAMVSVRGRPCHWLLLTQSLITGAQRDPGGSRGTTVPASLQDEHQCWQSASAGGPRHLDYSGGGRDRPGSLQLPGPDFLAQGGFSAGGHPISRAPASRSPRLGWLVPSRGQALRLLPCGLFTPFCSS